MHGLVFGALRDYTVERLGEERTEELWHDRRFDAEHTYEDEWFLAQLDRLARAVAGSRGDVEESFGVFAARTTFPALFPAYYAENRDTIAFLLGIEEQIHEVVRATIRGAAPPRLHVWPLQGEGALISYTSARRLCRLLTGLVHGTAAELGDPVDVKQLQCMHEGDPGCIFTVVRSAA